MADITCIDLFAGLGGFSEAARAAGCRVLWAANHWPAAVEWHARNHPGVEHACQDLRQADFTRAPRHDLLLASPSCQGHAKARGRERPHHDAARATAWAVVECVEACRPAGLIVENVPEFADWSLYRVWWRALATLGYRLSACKLDAADLGVPQNRVRLFVTGIRRDVAAAPVAIPTPEAKPTPVARIIDWNAGRWSLVEKPGRSPATLRRTAAGFKAFGPRFVMPYYGGGSGLTGRSLARPLGTVTTRDRWAIVDGARMRMLTAGELSAAMGFPAGYALPTSHKLAVHLLGNAVIPAAGTHFLVALAAAIRGKVVA